MCIAWLPLLFREKSQQAYSYRLRFLMGYSNNEGRKMHFLKWEWFNLPKEKGGTGLRSLTDLNQALVAKVAWRFLHDQDSLWSQLLQAKYLRDISFWKQRSRESAVPHGLRYWRVEITSRKDASG